MRMLCPLMSLVHAVALSVMMQAQDGHALKAAVRCVVGCVIVSV